MLTWIAGNLATIIISVILIIMVTVIIAGMRNSKRKGKASCGCGCAGCAMNRTCLGCYSSSELTHESPCVTDKFLL